MGVTYLEADYVFIRFSLVADEWPIEEFTTEIGISPTEAFKIGDNYICGTRQSKRFETVWSLETGEMELDNEQNRDSEFEFLTSKVLLQS